MLVDEETCCLPLPLASTVVCATTEAVDLRGLLRVGLATAADVDKRLFVEDDGEDALDVTLAASEGLNANRAAKERVDGDGDGGIVVVNVVCLLRSGSVLVDASA